MAVERSCGDHFALVLQPAMSKLSLKRRSPPGDAGLASDFAQQVIGKLAREEQGTLLEGHGVVLDGNPPSPKEGGSGSGTASKKRRSQGGGQALQEKQQPPSEAARGGRRTTAPKASLRELSDSEDSDGSGKENPAAVQRSAKPQSKGKRLPSRRCWEASLRWSWLPADVRCCPAALQPRRRLAATPTLQATLPPLTRATAATLPRATRVRAAAACLRGSPID